MLRRVPYKIDGLKALSVATVEKATRRPVDPDWFAGGGAWIDFAGPPGHFKEVVVLARGAAPVPAWHVPRQDRGDRRHGAGAAGHPPHLLARRGDGRARDPRERDRDAAARRAAARRERARRPPDRGRPHAGAGAARAAAAAPARARARRRRRRRVRRRGAARLRTGPDPAGRGAADRARVRARRGARRALDDRLGRAHPDPRPVLALRARLRRRPGARARRLRGRRAPRRRAADRDRPVQRPARVHELRRGSRTFRGDRRVEPVPDRDERRDPRPRRHARRLHGRWDHGRVRRADRLRRPRRQGARGGAHDAREARALQRVDARRGPRRRLQDGHRPQHRRRHVGQRRIGAATRVHGHRRYDEHRRASGGHDQGHAVPAVPRRRDLRAHQRARRTTWSRSTSSRCAAARPA